jgi:hypothetical protein
MCLIFLRVLLKDKTMSQLRENYQTSEEKKAFLKAYKNAGEIINRIEWRLFYYVAAALIAFSIILQNNLFAIIGYLVITIRAILLMTFYSDIRKGKAGSVLIIGFISLLLAVLSFKGIV